MLNTLRTHRLHVALFVAVYALGLLHLRPVGAPTIFNGLLAAMQSNEAAPRPAIGRSKPSQDIQPSPPDRLAPSVVAGQPHKEQIKPVTPLAQTNELPEETLREVNTLSIQATGAADPAERAKAIVKLRSAEKTPQSVQALANVVGEDQSAQNRLLAVMALLNLARQGDEDDVMRAALRRASADHDPRVAMRARQAIQMLSDAASGSE